MGRGILGRREERPRGRVDRQYRGFKQVIYRYLDCGILHNGFARVKCEDCNYEYLLAFSCKRRHFCRSCHQKRVIEFGEWLCEEILRRYFLYDRKLLSDLSRCGWEALKAFYTTGVRDSKSVPGAVVALQTFGLRLVGLRLGEGFSTGISPPPAYPRFRRFFS